MMLALLLLWPCAASAAPSATAKIAIYHTNDVHGWVGPKEAPWYPSNPKRLIGGAAAAAAALKRERLPKLLLDGGDWFQGTPESAFSGGSVMVDVFNALGYDAVVLGNHDFDYGLPQLEKLARALKMPVLGANVYREGGGGRPDFVAPRVIREVAGVKIGLFGLLTRNMRELAFEEHYAGLTFRREVDEARDQVRALKAEGAQVIVALTHVGIVEPGMQPFEDDKFLAGEVPGIDVIVGGHTHTRLKVAVRDPRNGTLITQTGSYLSQIGRIELEVDPETGKVVSSTSSLVELWLDEVGEDAGLERIVAPFREEADRRMSVVLATATKTLTRSRMGEAAIGGWFADCLRGWTGTDVAVQNHGGIRSDLPAGPVTLRRIFEIMPFDNRVATMSLSGAQLRDTLERGVSGSAGMLQVSGVFVRYKPDAAPGRRISEIRVGGRPLEPEGRYTVTAADFLVKRGDGFATLGQGEGTSFSGTLIRDVLATCARNAGVIDPPSPGRIVAEN